MKTQLRVSGFNDYVAVDIVDDKDKIISTPIYLQKGKVGTLKVYDQDDRKYYKTEVVFDGKRLNCISEDGLEWQSDINELVDGKTFKA